MSPSSKDRLLTTLLQALAAVVGLIVLLIFVFLVKESTPALTQVGLGRFFADESWHPAADATQGSFNLLPILGGTLLTSAGAILLAAPLGLFSALFCQLYAPPALGWLYRRMIELMAGVPSVVYGLWGLVVLVPWIGALQPPGPSLLAGMVILTLMILPTVALLSDAALASVPREYVQGATALGLSRSTTACQILLPAARSGLITAVILAVVRAIGETMAVLMVCGNVVRMPASLFDPVRTLTATIALEMGYARDDHRAALFACGLVLLVAVALLVIVAELFSRKKPYAGP